MQENINRRSENRKVFEGAWVDYSRPVIFRTYAETVHEIDENGVYQEMSNIAEVEYTDHNDTEYVARTWGD